VKGTAPSISLVVEVDNRAHAKPLSDLTQREFVSMPVPKPATTESSDR
jgi:hypothetical protein